MYVLHFIILVINFSDGQICNIVSLYCRGLAGTSSTTSQLLKTHFLPKYSWWLSSIASSITAEIFRCKHLAVVFSLAFSFTRIVCIELEILLVNNTSALLSITHVWLWEQLANKFWNLGRLRVYVISQKSCFLFVHETRLCLTSNNPIILWWFLLYSRVERR